MSDPFFGHFLVISEVGSKIYIAIFKFWVFSATFLHEITLYATSKIGPQPDSTFWNICNCLIPPWLTRKESWYVMYPHDANCKNKALLYLLKTDKANRRQNTHSRSFSRSKTISSTQCLVMANCFIRSCLILFCCGMKRSFIFCRCALWQTT